MLVKSIHRSLDELMDLLIQLSDTEYSNSCKALSNATIGEHTRHILEMFQCLEKSYDLEILNYDNRERDKRIQTDTVFAAQCILEVKKGLKAENKTIYLTNN